MILLLLSLVVLFEYFKELFSRILLWFYNIKNTVNREEKFIAKKEKMSFLHCQNLTWSFSFPPVRILRNIFLKVPGCCQIEPAWMLAPHCSWPYTKTHFLSLFNSLVASGSHPSSHTRWGMKHLSFHLTYPEPARNWRVT